jgi:hypothetical protein
MNRIYFLKSAIFFTITLLALLTSCEDDDTKQKTENQILIGNDIFKSYPDDPLIISAATIIVDSLQISFGSSCCDGKSWQVNLVGDSEVLYSLPPQRSIRLSLKNDELCTAVCGKTLKYDLSPCRVNGNQIILNLVGWDKPLIYNY